MRQSQTATLLDDTTLSAARNGLKSGVELARRRQRTQRAALGRLDRELQLAGALQRNLHAPPPLGNGVDFHVLYRPAGAVSGDTYDVTRLGPSSVSIALADATGHDLSAALLSVFVKRSLRGRELSDGAGRLLDPDEVLARANNDLIDAGLTECQFVTALYAVYDEGTRVIRWARAGAPYPILLRPGRPPQKLLSNGPLLGVLPLPTFAVAELQLRPGDTVLFHTDGLEALLSDERDRTDCSDPALAAWLQASEDAPPKEVLLRLENALDTAEQFGRVSDDVTVVGLSVHESIAAHRPTHNPDALVAAR
jgi:serine phosphatase RsbU (regulator of sigma subunit)